MILLIFPINNDMKTIHIPAAAAVIKKKYLQFLNGRDNETIILIRLQYNGDVRT